MKNLTPDEILKLRIADIACGSGSFLIAALRFMTLWMAEVCKGRDDWSSKYLERNHSGLKLTLSAKLLLLSNCIYGVDIDPEAVNVTKFSLYLEVLNDETPERIQRFYSERKRPILPVLDGNIRVGNSLVSVDILKERLFQNIDVDEVKPFDFYRSFPKVFENKGFDLIFGNPPYGATIGPMEKDYLRRYPLSKKNFNTANLFTDRVRNLVNRKGGWCFIVPKSLAYSDRWSEIRDSLRSNFILGVDASKAFKNVKLEQVIIACDPRRRAFRTGYISKTGQSVYSGVRHLPFTDILPVNILPEEIGIGEAIAENAVKASEYFKLARGAVPTRTLRSTGTVTVYRGKHVQGYTLLDSDEKISTSQAKGILQQHEHLNYPKVMAQQIVAHIFDPYPHIRFIGAYDDTGGLSVDTVSNIFLRDRNMGEFPLKLFLGVFNSTVCSWFADRFVYAKAIRTMHLDNYHLSKLLMPKRTLWGEPPAKRVVQLVDQRASITMPQADIADTDQAVEYAKAIERQIDELVGRLFGLSEKQMELIESAMGSKSLVEMGRLGKLLHATVPRSRSRPKKHSKTEMHQRHLF